MQLTQDDVVAALKWHIDMGLAEPICDLPVNHTSPEQALKPSISAAPSPPASPLIQKATNTPRVSAGLSEAITQARQLADGAENIESLLAAIHGFDGCSLKKTARHTVTHEGVWHSPVMVVGEAPGADEDTQGVPFCGASGQLLDAMLHYIGLKRQENCLISNMIYWRPPGNRQPTPEELAICTPFVEKMIALNAPKILVAVGGTAVKALLNESRGITRLRGKILSYTNPYLATSIPVHILLHPAYLLRQPMAKKQTWQDVLNLKKAIQPLS